MGSRIEERARERRWRKGEKKNTIRIRDEWKDEETYSTGRERDGERVRK